ncbi:MAG: neuraminidase (sialidase) [Acidobacteria bacterium]|jgi:predicted neuraminidase|nr:neuraminidase (sialidase) [Acidobacteriota bacterium]HJN46096.1 sialidase family protein [Vicinamibacterales bacterium]
MMADSPPAHRPRTGWRHGAGFVAFTFTIVFLPALSTMASAQNLEHTTRFIWEVAPFPRAHASTIVEAPDGSLIAAWFGGSGEGQEDVGVWSSRKPEGGEWSSPTQVYKEPEQPAWNPVLFRDASDTIWLFFKVGPSPRSWSGAYMKSTTSGQRWTDPVWLPAGMLGPVRAKPITLANGDILAGTSLESYRTWSSWMEISSDGGETWSKHGPILFGDMERDRRGTIQPTLLEIEPGVVRAFFRTNRMGKIAMSLSRDAGKSWSPLRLTDRDHPSAGIDTVRLDDGRCILIYNPSTTRRTPLSLAVSFDDGDTWKDFLVIEALEEGQRGELSYPAMIQDANGDLQITYTWNRRRIRHATVPFDLIPGDPAGAGDAAR